MNDFWLAPLTKKIDKIGKTANIGQDSSVCSTIVEKHRIKIQTCFWPWSLASRPASLLVVPRQDPHPPGVLCPSPSSSLSIPDNSHRNSAVGPHPHRVSSESARLAGWATWVCLTLFGVVDWCDRSRLGRCSDRRYHPDPWRNGAGIRHRGSRQGNPDGKYTRFLADIGFLMWATLRKFIHLMVTS